MHWALKRRFISNGLGIVSGITYPSGHTGLLILSAVFRELAAKRPLYRYRWGYRDTVPVYLGSLVHDSPRQFAGEALANHNQFFFVTSYVQRLRTFYKTLRLMPW